MIICKHLIAVSERTKLFLQRSDGNKFVRTSKYHECLEMLKENGSIVILGNPGEGKTRYGKELMKDVSPNLNCYVLDSPEQWDHINPTKAEAILIDNVFGDISFEESALKMWKNKLQTISHWVHDEEIASTVMVIITARDYILLACENKLRRIELFGNSNRVHLSSGELSLQEKETILTGTLSGSDASEGRLSLEDSTIKAIAECYDCMTIGFPQSCQFFANSPALFSKGLDFFKQPQECIEDLVLDLKANDVCGFLLLSVSMFYEGAVSLNMFDKHSTLLSDLAEELGYSSSTLQFDIQKKLQQYNGTFFYYNDATNEYRFSHDAILDSMLSVYVKMAPSLFIGHLSIRVLLNVLRTGKCHAKGTVVMPSTCFAELAKRLTDNLAIVLDFNKFQIFDNLDFLNTFLRLVALNETFKRRKMEFLLGLCEAGLALDDISLFGKCLPDGLCNLDRERCVLFRKIKDYILSGDLVKAYKMLRLKGYTPSKDDFNTTRSKTSSSRIFQFLIETMEDLNTADVFTGCCQYGLDKTVNTLLKEGIKPTEKDFRMATEKGHLNLIQLFIQTNSWTQEALRISIGVACRKGHREICRLLFANNECSAEHIRLAVTEGHMELAKELLDSKEWTGEELERVFSAACESNVIDMCVTLIQGGFVPTTNHMNVACNKNFPEICTLLMKSGVQLTKQHVTDLIQNATEATVLDLVRNTEWDASDLEQFIYWSYMIGSSMLCKFWISKGGSMSPLHIDELIEHDHVSEIDDFITLQSWDEFHLSLLIGLACVANRQDIFQKLTSMGGEAEYWHFKLLLKYSNFKLARYVISFDTWCEDDFCILLDIACEAEVASIVSVLLQKGAKVSVKHILCAIRSKDKDLLTSLIIEASLTANEKATLLLESCKQQFQKGVETIIQLGTRISLDVLSKFIKNDSLDPFRMLMKFHKWEPWELQAMLYEACNQNAEDIAIELIRQGTAVNTIYIKSLIKWNRTDIIVHEMTKTKLTEQESLDIITYAINHGPASLLVILDFILHNCLDINKVIGLIIDGHVLVNETIIKIVLFPDFYDRFVDLRCNFPDIDVVRQLYDKCFKSGNVEATRTVMQWMYDFDENEYATLLRLPFDPDDPHIYEEMIPVDYEHPEINAKCGVVMNFDDITYDYDIEDDFVDYKKPCGIRAIGASDPGVSESYEEIWK